MMRIFSRHKQINMLTTGLLLGQQSKTKQSRRRVLVFLVCLFGSFAIGASVQAQVAGLNMQSVFAGTFGTASITTIILRILQVFFAILGFLTVVLMIYGGFIWMTSQGDPGKVDKAKQIIYNTVIGLIIIFSSYAIASFIIGIFSGGGGGGGGGTYNIPGGGGDFSRSAIGAGPISSVYPAPNQVNVPINTRIAVTFKENIQPASICEESTTDENEYCDGEPMKNISICEISSDSSDCLADPAFNIESFVGSPVYQVSATDNKTFVIYPKQNLGNEDSLDRMFKVRLGKDINAVATNKSIFSGFRTDYYHWAFKTNGELDLTPPEISKYEIYPVPDYLNEGADVYTVDTAASAGVVNLTINNPKAEEPVYIRNYKNGSATDYEDLPYFANESKVFSLKIGAGSTKAQINIASGLSINSTGNNFADYSFIVNDDSASAQFYNANRDWIAKLGITNFNNCGSASNPSANKCLNIESNKRTIKTNGGFNLESIGDDFVAGNRFILTAKPAQLGDTLVFADGDNQTYFVYASSAYNGKEKITRKIINDAGQTVSTDYYVIIKGNDDTATAVNTATVLNQRLGSKIIASADAEKVVVIPRSAGENQLSLTSSNTSNLILIGSLSGTAREVGWTIKPVGTNLKDLYNNSKIRITFTEAINPVGLDSFIKVYGGSPIRTLEVDAFITLTNQYKTVELTGVKVCGINSCGDQIYCWVDPSNQPASSPLHVQIKAATLKYCASGNQDDTANAWCKNWGGVCDASEDRARCRLAESGLYYPQANGALPDGITDMTSNSFNGNFNRAVNQAGASLPKAEGQSIGLFTANADNTDKGKSGFASYYANSYLDANNRYKYSYTSNNSFGDDFFGDDFLWSFFVSNQVDLTPPSIRKVEPTGNQNFGYNNNERFNTPVKATFNGLMSYNTIKPGYGYGTSTTDYNWHIRHLLLKTLTASANPVGYWTGGKDIDFDNDGLADYTIANLYHNPYDQSVSYGPLAGSGLQSITQNCFLPGNGPQNAGDASATVTGEAGVNNCHYVSGKLVGCMTDSSIPDTNRVTSTNPASYGYLNCNQIDGAVVCTDLNKTCKTQVGNNIGSWIITKDYPNATNGRTGCCFGRCIAP